MEKAGVVKNLCVCVPQGGEGEGGGTHCADMIYPSVKFKESILSGSGVVAHAGPHTDIVPSSNGRGHKKCMLSIIVFCLQVQL